MDIHVIMKRSRRRPVKPLPDEIIMDILSRLPADEIVNLRKVCRIWKDLISNQYFAKMHTLSCTSPSIIKVVNWGPSRKRIKIHRDCYPYFRYNFILSYHGLIALSHWTRSVILNPITGDQVIISGRRSLTQSQLENGEIYGIFLHPHIEEYHIILGFEIGLPRIQFKMLRLGPQPCCNNLKLPPNWAHKPRHSPPVVVDDDGAILYWMVDQKKPSCEEAIMAFDVKTEQFVLMPHPDPTAFACHSGHHDSYILEMDGRLSWGYSTDTGIEIWTLKDFGSRIWVKSYSISIDEYLKPRELRAMAMGDGELLLMHWWSRRLYAYNLKAGIIRTSGRPHKYAVSISAHTPSFVSLKNCKPLIYLDEILDQ